MGAFFVGTTVRIDGVFTQPDENGVAQPYDPSPEPTLKLYHRGSATEIVPTVLRDGVGLYHADVTVTAAGPWAYRWAVAGLQPAADEGGFRVEYSGVPAD